MPEKRQFRAIKGTRDILPPDSALWSWFERAAHEVFESYNFREIRPPIFEESSIFARSIGGETDVVAKEMYTFEDKAGGLPDPGDVAPEEYLESIKRGMSNGQLSSNPSLLARLEHELSNFRQEK